MDVWIALVHYPIKSRHGEVSSTAVTNLDLHDLARLAASYGVRGYFVVTPIAQQRSLVERIVLHWLAGEGRQSNPIRARAFELVEVADTIEAARDAIADRTGVKPLTIATGARHEGGPVEIDQLRRRIMNDSGAALVLFGTGWGLTDEAVAACDVAMPAIRRDPARTPDDGYNHLSVRAAAAITIDRLLGQR